MSNKFLVFIGVLLSVSLASHGQTSQESVDPAEAMKALGALMGGGSTNATIHFRQLKELLPAEYNGMKRSNSEAGKNATFGMNVSYAQADYTKDNARIGIKISDISSMGAFMKMAQFAWAQSEIEKETDDGFERTSKIDGHAAQENYQYSGKSGEIQVMVGERFIVEVSGSGVEFDEMKGLLKTVDLNRLNSLKPEPATN